MEPTLNLPKKKKFLDVFYVHKENNEQYKIDCDRIDYYNILFENKPKILWYPSAGQDFKPVNFLSQLNIQRLQHEGTTIKTPNLFVYSCLGPELKSFVRNYENANNNFILHEDLGTIIETIEFIPLEIIRGTDFIDYNINHAYIKDFYGIDPLINTELNCDYDAFFMKGRITHKQEGIKEDFYLLYCFQENINFFQEFIIKKNIFDVLWLCTDREGCGMGGGGKSMITHIYVDNAPSCYQEHNFKPQYIIPFTDFTLRELQESDEKGYIHLNPIQFNNPLIYNLVYQVNYNENNSFKIHSISKVPSNKITGCMPKSDLEKTLLSLLKSNDPKAYAEFISTLPDKIKILWYPSAGEDFLDLIHTHERYEHKMEQIPDLFIHTDYFPWENSDFLDSPIVLKDGKTEIKVQSITELNYNPKDILYELNNNIVNFPDGSKASGKVILLKLNIKSDVLGEFERYVLYFFFENTNFLKEIIFKFKIKISHLVIIRDGAGLGGGGNVNFKFLEFYLGMLETQYLLTDNFGRGRVGFELIRDDKELVENYNLPENKPVLLKGIIQLYWSGYGVFCDTDAIIMKIERF